MGAPGGSNRVTKLSRLRSFSRVLKLPQGVEHENRVCGIPGAQEPSLRCFLSDPHEAPQ